MRTELQPFRYEDIELSEACYIDGEPHFTRRAIGQWLEYSDPQRAVDLIILRNPHINQFSVHIKLKDTDGKMYKHRVYNPIGFQLIVFESGQPKAKAYKVAVANMVWAFMKGELKLTKEDPQQVRHIDLLMGTVAQLSQVVEPPPGDVGGTAVGGSAERRRSARETLHEAAPGKEEDLLDDHPDGENRGSWLVTHGSWLVARDSWLVTRDSWLVTRGS